MAVNSVVSAGSYPVRHNKRENKVIETARNNISNSDISSSAAINSTKLAAFADTDEINQVVRVASITFSGANAIGEVASTVTLPDNAIILRVTEDAIALTGTTDDTGTAQLLLGTGGTAITAANVMPAAGVTEVVTSSTGLLTKNSAATILTLKIVNRAMASGTLKFFVEYVLGD